jgi:predicted MFS family arabinose efflux permease
MGNFKQESNRASELAVSVKNRFVLSLMFANFSTNMMDFLMSIFLVDVALVLLGSASTSNVAFVSQLITISNIASLAVGLLLSAICIRVRYKTLLMAGLLCVSIGSIGCSIAPDIIMLHIFYPLDGVGTILIGSMAYAIAGQHLPINKRGKAIGFIIAGSPISGLVGSFVIEYFFGTSSGWRGFMLLYVLPVSILAFVLIFFSVPSKHTAEQTINKVAYKEKLSQIFFKKNIIACLMGNLFRYIGSVWAIFGIAFVRTKFDLTAYTGAGIVLAGNIGLILGMVLAGHLVDRVGRKRLVIASTFLTGCMFLIYVSSGNLYVATLLWTISGLLGGLSFSSDINFTLEQTSMERGTLMSINSSFMYLGVAIGSFIGGNVLSRFNYETVALTFAFFIFVAVIIFLTLTKEPCQDTRRTLTRGQIIEVTVHKGSKQNRH